jgi:hypothetical protein
LRHFAIIPKRKTAKISGRDMAAEAHEHSWEWKMRISALILTVLSLLEAFVSGSFAAEGRGSQEQCRTLAAQYFTREYGGSTSRNDYVDPDTHKTLFDETRTAFTAHYQSQQNKCFIVTSIENVTSLGQAKNSSIWLIVIELNENHAAGLFHQTNDAADVCFIGPRDCRSRAEWDLLLKSYLQD